MTQRYFSPDPPDEDGLVQLSGDEAHHLCRVMRLGPGDAVTLFDGRGGHFAVRVVSTGKRVVVLQVEHPLAFGPESAAVAMAVAMPKGDRQRWVVEKLTELGVSKLIPLLSQRGVVQTATVSERWRRTVIEACKQSGRNQLMEIGPPARWEDLLRDSPSHALRLIAHPSPHAEPLSDVLAKHRPSPALFVVAAIGPEGGWTDQEIDAATQAGWTLTRLGRHVLRTDTAAAACAAMLCERCGN